MQLTELVLCIISTYLLAQLNSDLSGFSFRDNSGIAEYSTDGGTTWNKIGGGGMPILDFNNPLYTFSQSNTSYTAVKECWVSGVIFGAIGGNVTCKIDGKSIGAGVNTSTTGSSGNGGVTNASILRKVGVGQVVAITGASVYMNIDLGIYEEM